MRIDKVIQAYLKEKLGINNIHAFKIRGDEGIAFRFSRNRSNNKINQIQLTLDVISKDYDRVMDLEIEIDKILDFKASMPTVERDGISFRAGRQGGGCFQSEEFFENNLIYIINYY